MSGELLTVNRYLKEEDFESLELIEAIRDFVKESKSIRIELEEYNLFDVGFIPIAGVVLVKLYFTREG